MQDAFDSEVIVRYWLPMQAEETGAIYGVLQSPMLGIIFADIRNIEQVILDYERTIIRVVITWATSTYNAYCFGVLCFVERISYVRRSQGQLPLRLRQF